MVLVRIILRSLRVTISYISILFGLIFRTFHKKLTLSSAFFPLLFSVRVYVCFVYLNHSISIVCVSRERLIESNQQIYDFYKRVIFEKQKHCGEYIFDTSDLSIQCNTHSCCEDITGAVNMYLYECVSLLAPECTQWPP